MIDWMGFVTVFGTALFAASAVVALYSFGIRFLATPPRDSAATGPSRDDEDDDVDSIGRPKGATIAAYVCFTLSAVCVLYGIYLIVPFFRS